MRVRNWQKFQHFKDRTPPWVKLHRSLLDNEDWCLLSGESAKALAMLWLLASEYGGGIPDEKKASFRLRMDVSEYRKCVAELLERGFLIEGDAAEEEVTPDDLRQIHGYAKRYITDAVKREVWNRDKGKCRACGSEENIEYDHMIPVSKGGNSDTCNVQLLCRKCNRVKRTKTAEHLDTPVQPDLSRRTLETETETEVEKEKEKPLARSPVGPRPIGSGEVLITIPDNKGQEIPICKGFVDELEKAYPIVDALQTLREIRAWTIANKAKRKTASGMGRFVQSWFAREQNRG